MEEITEETYSNDSEDDTFHRKITSGKKQSKTVSEDEIILYEQRSSRNGKSQTLKTFKKDKQSEDEKSEVIDFKDQFSRGTEVYRKSMKSARHRDYFGFRCEEDESNKDDEENAKPKSSKNIVAELKKNKKLQQIRIKKWQKMLEDFPEKFHFKLKKRARKGIPDSFRGTAWKTLACSCLLKEENSSINYYNLLKIKADKKDINDIFKDIHRTFPKHEYFEDMYGIGQKTLFNVLKNLSLICRDTGYVQGMGYITAILLMYMNEEDAFWTIISILSKYGLKKFYLPSMPGLFEAFYVLISFVRDKLPKTFKFMKENNITPSMFATQWFMTIFTVGFSFECTVRAFDAYLTEGPKVLFRIALYILKQNEPKFLSEGI